MALSPEALDDLKKIIASQVDGFMAQNLPQQVSQHLTLERERNAKNTKEVTSESECEHTPTLSDSMRIAKGKGLAGTSKFRAIRNIHPVHAEREEREPRRPARVEPIRQEKRSPRQGAHGRRSQRRDIDDSRDPERQQLKHIKAKFPLFHDKNDSEAYLDWERKMESNVLCHDTYASNKVKIVIS
ncbi:unnamed protein product [Cochlearia groenlandica]